MDWCFTWECRGINLFNDFNDFYFFVSPSIYVIVYIYILSLTLYHVCFMTMKA